MARRPDKNHISVNLIIDRRLWHVARYLNTVLGPARHSRGMQEWVTMLIGRYVQQQLDDPDTMAKLKHEFFEVKARATHAASKRIVDDCQEIFWKEDTREFLASNSQESDATKEA